MNSVRLDQQGRVIGVASGPPRQGWVPAPQARDLWRLQRAQDGEWLEMSERGASHRDHDHTPAPPDDGPRARLLALRDRAPHNLSRDELAQAVLDLINVL